MPIFDIYRLYLKEFKMIRRYLRGDACQGRTVGEADGSKIKGMTSEWWTRVWIWQSEMFCKRDYAF